MGLLEGILYTAWRGLAIGIIISAPMGPVGILCVQRTLEKGRASGFFTGVGASISDLFYCLLTGFGLSFIEEFLKANQTVIQIFGSVVLILFGLYLFKSHPARKIKKPVAEKTSKGKNVLGGFLFTFSNPLIIFLIIGLFARFDFFLPEISFGFYVVGYIFIILGALFWWWVVTFFVDKVRAHFNLRSMWLINKITGGIIMIFAVVGIITAFTSSASADVRPPLYLNSTRGFGPLVSDQNEGEPLVISNEGCDSVIRILPLDDARNFSFSFKAANLNNASKKKYSFFDAQRNKKSVRNPNWGFLLRGEGFTSTVSIATLDSPFDELYPVQLKLTIGDDDGDKIINISDGVDFYTGANSFLIRVEDGKFSLSLGNRGLKVVLEDLELGFVPESVGFFVSPGASLKLDDMCLRVMSESTAINTWSHFANSDVRNSYFSRSVDPVEGEWEIFDHMLEDDDLRLGGNYRLACVANDTGYDLVYLDGAAKMSEKWQPGMLKASLEKTAFKDVYDVLWLDPAQSPIVGDIKAQVTSPGVLSFQFPEHGASTLRLRKIKK